MLGIVTIEIGLAPASMLMLESTHNTPYTADLTAATNKPYRQQVGRTTLAANVAFRNGLTIQVPAPLD